MKKKARQKVCFFIIITLFSLKLIKRITLFDPKIQQKDKVFSSAGLEDQTNPKKKQEWNSKLHKGKSIL